MKTSQILRRRTGRLLVVPVAALALAAACSSVSSYAATVDGTRIETGTLEGELRDLGSNDKYLKLRESQIEVPVRTNGVFDAAFTSMVLSREIIYDLVEKDLERRKIVVTPDDLEAARTAAMDRIGGEEVFTAFPKGYQDTLVKRAAQVTLLSFALMGPGSPEEQSKAFYDANGDVFALACVSHILVATREEADQIKGRLDAGEPFAEVAKTTSTDQGSASKGGELGCYGKQNQLVPEFSQAMFSLPVGAVGAPVQTQFGQHLIFVRSRDVPPYDQVATQVREQAAAAAQEKLSAWADETIAKADISVNPKYGTFEKAGAQSRVVPPEAPTSATTAPAPGGGTPEPPPADAPPG
ncbi:MAG: peptidylprolyl isomerase [Acidimicrobiales bacterium]